MKARNASKNMINQFIGEYNEVQSEENSINKYKNALIWYLEYNRDLIASQNRKAEIKVWQKIVPSTILLVKN